MYKLQQLFNLEGWYFRLLYASESQTILNILIIILSGFTVSCWFILYKWFSLFDYYHVPLFALDKIPGYFNAPLLRWTTLVFLFLSCAYIMNYYLIKKASTITLPIKLGIVLPIVGGIINIFIHPITAIDVFVYLNQLKLVHHYHQNPYLVTLLPSYASDPWVKYGASFMEVPLVYGPFWVTISKWPLLLAGGFENLLQSLLAYKFFSLLFVVLSGILIFVHLTDPKEKWLGLYIFVANPLILFEAVGNAHNDIMMATFLLAAIVAMKRMRSLVLPLLLISSLIKAFTILLVPVFIWWMFNQKWSKAQMTISFLLALCVLFAQLSPFWANAGMVKGMLHAVSVQQSLYTASIYSLVKEWLVLNDISDNFILAIRFIFVSLFILFSIIIVRGRMEFERSLTYILLLFFLFVSSLFPWYLTPVIALLALKRSQKDSIYLLLGTLLGVLNAPLSIWAWFNSGFIPFQVHLFQALFLTLPIVLLILPALLGSLKTIRLMESSFVKPQIVPTKVQ